MKKLSLGLLPAVLWLCFTPLLARAATYYVGPTGDDGADGQAVATAWASLGRAWPQLQPGDTLVLLDGVYLEPLEPSGVNGTAAAPITIQAQHDGQVIIDGQGVNIPVHLYRDYYVIEGVVARNGNHAVYFISGSNNTLRRVSGYDANPDDNSDVFAVFDSHNNLIEDCVAAGTGRKMVMIYRGSHNMVRRCFADWQRWDGRSWCDDWPWGDNLQVYNSDYNIIENSIGYGSVPVWSIAVQANAPDVSAVGNQLLGNISIFAGMNHDGTVKQWGPTRPQPTDCTQLRDFGWPSQRAGFAIYGNGLITDNTFRDLFAWGGAGLGLTAILDGQHRNNVIDHVTLLNNGLDNPADWGGVGAELRTEENWLWDQRADFWVEASEEQGIGARLGCRYVNGQLTTTPLWPWPMEDRIRAEMGFSPTTLVSAILAYGPSTPPLWAPLIQDGRLVTTAQERNRRLAFDKADTLYYDDPWPTCAASIP